MTVRDLINALETVKNKDKEVALHLEEGGYSISSIDESQLGDKVVVLNLDK